ncbi:hypothetical protein ACFQX4_27895, partial [Roseomonas sp. GCM10028921]
MGELASAAAVGALAPALPLSAEALDYAREATSVDTRRAYRAAWADFTAWCEANGREALPAAPEAAGPFLAAHASTHRASSFSMRLVAIGQAHRLAEHRLDTGHPTIRETMKGIRRIHGTAASRKDAAVSTVVRHAVDGLAKQQGLRPLRGRALLLIGFAAALRRSELVALDVADLAFLTEGIVLARHRRLVSAYSVALAGQGLRCGRGHAAIAIPLTSAHAWNARVLPA